MRMAFINKNFYVNLKYIQTTVRIVALEYKCSWTRQYLSSSCKLLYEQDNFTGQSHLSLNTVYNL